MSDEKKREVALGSSAVSDLTLIPEASDVHIANLIFESISDGVFTTDKDCRITSFNRAAEQISGFSRTEALGQFCFDIFRSDVCLSRCPLRHTLVNGEEHRNVRANIISRDGRKVPISVSTTVLYDKRGRARGAVEFFHDLSQLENLRAHIFKLRQMEDLISSNEEMQRIFSLLPEIADSECTVLIQGPSGSGKELIAQAIHNLSPRKDNPYIKINCAALPENLLESELFGYVKGAFTDAKRDKPGQFLLAHGGTLLLDEIAEMPLPLQAKLLRVLNNGEFHPLGSVTSYHSDARIISATNRNLEELVQRGKFREDLYYRINVIAVHVPPLKDRLEDLPVLIEYFISKFSAKRGKAIQGISPSALQVLRKYDFPGNIRELENAIEHAFVLCNRETIDVCHLPPKILQAVAEKENSASRNGLPEKSEEAIIREALFRNLGNREKTAQELGLHRTTLWRKMKKYHLDAGK
jgi:PAS domain S-box-containing protein